MDQISKVYVIKYEFLFIQNVFKNFIDERVPTPIEDDTYDVMICCAGFFQSLISPKAFPELIRITKKGTRLSSFAYQGFTMLSLVWLWSSFWSKDPLIELIHNSGGILMWNQMEGYNFNPGGIPSFDQSVQFLIDIGRWTPFKTIQCDLLRFSDCGSAHLRGLESSGVTAPGFVFIMVKLA